MSEDEKKVLCVDDEVSILSALKRLLRKEDYHLLTASSGEEGLALLETHKVQLVISDQRMPKMTGVEFLQKVKESYPDTVRVILSGYANVNVLFEAINRGEIYRFFAKPWSDEELKIAIQQCLSHYDLLAENRVLIDEIRGKNEELERLNKILEHRVDERTRVLELSQQILGILPLPVVGVSNECMIVIANQAAGRFFPKMVPLPPGVELRDVFPEKAIRAVKDCLDGVKPDGPVIIQLQQRAVSLHLEALKSYKSIVGCLVLLEVESGR